MRRPWQFPLAGKNTVFSRFKRYIGTGLRKAGQKRCMAFRAFIRQLALGPRQMPSQTHV
jgi:hypothetical protein